MQATSKMSAPIPNVEAGLFCREVENEVGSVMALYARREAYSSLISQAEEALGVSAYAIGVLVGVNLPDRIYKWKSGKVRPSVIYCLRLAQLLAWELQAPGKVFLMRRVNWETGEITWKEGVPWA